MEHEFDKEMDGLLRGFGRQAESRSVPAGTHADADQLAAFLEGALPAAARANLIGHTANCDTCRELFAAAVDLHEAAVPETPVSAPVFEPKRRWRFLGMPAFAAALSGLLVVVFVGLIGVRYFSRVGEGNIVAQKSADEGQKPTAATPETSANQSVYSQQIPLPEVNAQANSNAAAVANTGRSENVPSIAPRSFAEAPQEKADGDELAKRATETQNGMPSQPMVSSGAPALKPEKKDVASGLQGDGARDNEKMPAASRKEADDADARAKSAPPAAADRALRSQAASPAQTRVVSGKTFTRRDGIWYDSAYKGGKTTDVARKCDKCGAMDPGLERIVTALPGTIIVVWQGKDLRFN
ncbi:MAG TPA: zf-HC2 domain-containing protein [Pyrinomonadaceae bacterium]|nr:zf-HC2 domain-containing protein [Pyrinomonadaceae bacterium]